MDGNTARADDLYAGVLGRTTFPNILSVPVPRNLRRAKRGARRTQIQLRLVRHTAIGNVSSVYLWTKDH